MDIYIKSIDTRIKSNQTADLQNTLHNGLTLGPRETVNNSIIVGVTETDDLDLSRIILNQGSLTTKRPKAPFGPLIRESSEQRKISNYEKYQRVWNQCQKSSY